MKDGESILKMPEGVSPNGPVQDISEACLKAIMALPEILTGIGEVLNQIDSSLDTIALYFERRGVSEGHLSPEDLSEERDDGSDA